MADLTKIAISVTVRDRAKQTQIWDHKGYKSQITNIFENSLITSNMNLYNCNRTVTLHLFI